MGGNYGWRSPQLGQFWRKPPYFIDCVPPVCYLGRGSPTGVACYRHTHFPEKYRGGFFLADWTFGRIHFVPLTEHFSTYRSKPEVFAEATGTSGFAPTALAVHPKTGELYVSIGGRGTRGGVYRIGHEGSPAGKPLPMAKRSLDYDKDAAQRWLADCRGRWFPFPEPRARRQALELLRRWWDKGLEWNAVVAAVAPNLDDPDPLIRLAAARAAASFGVPSRFAKTTFGQLALATADHEAEPGWAVYQATTALRNPRAGAEAHLHAIRLVQLVYGDLTAAGTAGTVWEGYTLANPGKRTPSAELLGAIRGVLRSDDADVAREAARTLVALDDQELRTAALTPYLTADSHPLADIHILALLGRVPGNPSGFDTRRIAMALVLLEGKLDKHDLARDTNWPLRLTEIVQQLGEKKGTLADAVGDEPHFGRPEHVFLVTTLDIPRKQAAKVFLATAATEPGFRWTPGVVSLLDAIPADVSRPILLRLIEKPGLRDAVVRVLAKSPHEADRGLFVQGLDSVDSNVMVASAAALSKGEREGQHEVAAAVKALRRLAPEEKSARTAVRDLLRTWTGEKFEADPKAWSEWLTKTYPATARLLETEGFDPAAWKKREEAIPWEKGDAIRGRAAFAKASCAACHDTGRAIGPSLLGVAKRFGRDDLLTSIVQPGKDVSPRYRPVRVTTTEETVFLGMIVYEATDGVILQLDVETTVRIAGEKIASKRAVDASLMPAGLLDKLTDAEIADLFAYLRSLEEPKPK